MARFRMKAIAGVVALVLLAISAIALSFIALQRNRGVPENTPAYTYTPNPNVTKPGREDLDLRGEVKSDADRQQGADGAEPQEQAEAPVPVRFLTLGADGHMFRGEYGSCPDSPGWSEVSFNGGADWQPTNANAKGAVQILDVRISTADIQELIVLNDKCEPIVLRSYIGGISWTQMAGMEAERWFFNSVGISEVHTPAGKVEAPCDVVQLAVSRNLEVAAILCRDTSVLVSHDQGRDWYSAGRVPGVTSLAVEGETVFAATVNTAACQGVGIRSLVEDSWATIGSCYRTQTASDAAVAVYHDEITIWIGEELSYSVNNGEDWTKLS